MPENEEAAAQKEAERIEVLKKYDILDTPPDGSFDQFSNLAANLLDMPIAIVSLVDTDRIWFKSHYGLEINEIGRDPGLCSSAILSDDFYLVEDAKKDPRTLANPLVAGDFGLRFYAAAPLKTKEGHNLGTLCVLDKKPRKLTKAKKEILENLAELVVNQMELRLEARNAVKHQHQILNTTAHDLKNPLSIMPLLADMILMNKENPIAIDDIATQIKQAGKRMANILDDLLETAREQTGRVQLRLKAIDLAALVKGVIGTNIALAKKKNQLLIYDNLKSCTVYADHRKLTEVMDNLINNAIKFSPKDTKITISIMEKKQKAIVTVKDEGPGLTRDDMKSLFQPFTSLSAEPTGGENSSGFGLSICRHLVQAHNGKIYAKSDGEGKGAAFYVELPLSEN